MENVKAVKGLETVLLVAVRIYVIWGLCKAVDANEWSENFSSDLGNLAVSEKGLATVCMEKVKVCEKGWHFCESAGIMNGMMTRRNVQEMGGRLEWSGEGRSVADRGLNKVNQGTKVKKKIYMGWKMKTGGRPGYEIPSFFCVCNLHSWKVICYAIWVIFEALLLIYSWRRKGGRGGGGVGLGGGRWDETPKYVMGRSDCEMMGWMEEGEVIQGLGD